MFEYDLAHWSAFLIAAFVLNLSPGPDITYILAQTAQHGRKGGFAAMFGVWTGFFFHVLLAAAGLSAILAASAVAFTVVKWVGAAYLVWLGIQALRSNGGSYVHSEKSHSVPARQIYTQGVLVAALNPKVAVFFLAFLPQFVVSGAGPVSAQLVLHGSLIIVVAAFIEPFAVVLASNLTKYLKQHQHVAIWIDRGVGAVFISLGLRLVTSEK